MEKVRMIRMYFDNDNTYNIDDIYTPIILNGKIFGFIECVDKEKVTCMILADFIGRYKNSQEQYISIKINKGS